MHLLLLYTAPVLMQHCPGHRSPAAAASMHFSFGSVTGSFSAKAPETTPASSSAVESTDSSVSSGADSYTSLFPTLYADKYDGEYENSENTVYLTFDDGPSVLTENLLYYLRQENVKATFFVVPERTEYCYSLLREISNAGHTIGIHSASHDYEKIYASVDAFLEDFIRNLSEILCSNSPPIKTFIQICYR